MRKKRILTLALLGILIISNVVRAVAAPAAPTAPSRLLTYQGHLLDTTGLPVADGAYSMAFSLWDAATDGAQLWGPEAHTVTVTDGYFALLLGTEIPLDAAHFTDDTYLEIAVSGETLTSRQPLGAVAYALGASQAEHAVTADDAALLGGAAPEVYHDWRNLTHVPDGFADGLDNDTLYTDDDALSAVQAAGYLTATGVIEVLSTTHTLTVTVAHALTANDAETLNGQAGDYYLDWRNFNHIPDDFADGVDNDTTYSAGFGLALEDATFSVIGAPWSGLVGIPAGFADGVDNDTVYTDEDALLAVEAAGYVTSSEVISVVNQAGYVTDVQVLALITNTTSHTSTYAFTAGDAATLNGHAWDYYLDWRNFTHVPDDFTDGVDNDTTYTAGSGLRLDGTMFSVTGAPWSGLTGVPTGFADGVDNDTTYAASTGITLSGTQFSVAVPYRLPQSCTSGQIAEWNGTTWVCASDNDSGGDITAVTAGTGLTGGGTTGSVALAADTAYLQRRVSSTCAVGSSIRAINADGTVLCEADDNTTYTAGDGLALIGTQFSLSTPYQLPQTCANGQMPQWNGAVWDCGSPVVPGYARTLVVAASGGDFISVQAAVNSITDASATNPYLVWIAPGVYAETVTLKPYVHLQGAGRDVTVLQGNITDDDGSPTDKATLILDNNTSVRDLSVNNSGSEGQTRVGILVPMGKSNVRVVDVNVSSGGTARSSFALWIAGRATLENVTATASGGTVINAAMMVKAQSAYPPFPAEATLYDGVYTASGTNAMGIKVENLDSRMVVNAAYISATEALYSDGWIEVYHSRLEAPTHVVVNTQASQPQRALVKYTEFVGAGGIFNTITCVAVSRGATFGATTCP